MRSRIVPDFAEAALRHPGALSLNQIAWVSDLVQTAMLALFAAAIVSIPGAH